MSVITRIAERVRPVKRPTSQIPDEDLEKLMKAGVPQPTSPGISEFFTQEELDSLKTQGYEPVRYIGSGYTRDVFESVFRKGALTEIRALKVLKRDLESKANLLLKSNLARFPNRDPNYNELTCVSNIGYHPNIVRIIDSLDICGRTATVEEYVDGQTLEELVKVNGRQGKGNIRRIFTQEIDAVDHLHNGQGREPYIWRDGKASNILIDRRGKVYIDDLQTAKPKSQIESKVMPTMGGGGYASPDVVNALVFGKESCCNERTDIHSVGVSMYLAAVGRKPFEFKIKEDPNGIPCEIDGQIKTIAIYDGDKKLDGMITPEYYQRKLRKAMKAVPWQYRKMIGRCLSPGNSDYNIRDLRKDFDKVMRPSYFERHKHQLLKSGLVAALAIETLGPFAQSAITNYQHSQNELKKYPVAGECIGSGLGIENNLMTLDVDARQFGDYSSGKSYPKNRFLEVTAGETLNVDVSGSLVSRPNNSIFKDTYGPSLNGKIYIEGQETEQTFLITPLTKDNTRGVDEWGASMGNPWRKVAIPENLPDGIYNLVVEVYAQEPSKDGYENSYEKQFKFQQPGKAISRKVIPLIKNVDPKDRVYLRSLSSGFSKSVSFDRLEDEEYTSTAYNPNEKVDVRLIGENYSQTINGDEMGGVTLDLPESKDTTEKILQFVVTNKQGKRVYSRYVPVRRATNESYKRLDHAPYLELACPDSSFSHKVRKLESRLGQNPNPQMREYIERMFGRQYTYKKN